MSNMMRVLMFNKLYHPHVGGVERAVYDLCEEIKKEVGLNVLATNTRPRTEIEHKDNYKVVRVASLGRILSSVHLGVGIPKWWRRLKGDLMHFHFPSPIAELYYLALHSNKKPLVVSYHADIVGYNKALMFYRPFLFKFLERADRIIVASPDMRERSPFLTRFKNKCVVIPYGIQTEKFRLTEAVKSKSEAIRRRFKKPIVLFVGRLVKYKGINYLIEAMKDVDANLLIVGKGPEEKKLRRLIDKIGVEKGKVCFVGPVDDEDLPAYYHASQLFVLPSVSAKEAFGITQLEAHACAKPVVSTALPTGVPFVNRDGETGIVVPPGSAQKLAEAINRLLKDDALRWQLGQRAKERVEAEFTCRMMAQRTLDSYREVINNS